MSGDDSVTRRNAPPRGRWNAVLDTVVREGCGKHEGQLFPETCVEDGPLMKKRGRGQGTGERCTHIVCGCVCVDDEVRPLEDPKKSDLVF